MPIHEVMKRLIFLLYLAVSFVYADETVFELGGNTGWEKLVHAENISFTRGRFGLTAVQLNSEKLMLNELSDLFLNFDSRETKDEAGNYRIISSSFLQGSPAQSKYGTGSALCTPQSKAAALVLKPLAGSFFAGDEVLASFTIEFWIKPEVSDAGSSIFRWQSSLAENAKIIYQHIGAMLIQNKLEWNLNGVWQKAEQGLDITIKSKSNILPEQWSHHLLSYNSETACLEYRMNGHIEAIEFLTASRHEGAEILYAKLGKGKLVEIGKNYSGYLDEFKVKRSADETQHASTAKALFEKLPLSGGRFESKIIDAGGNYAHALQLITDEYKPTQTDIRYYIRTSNEAFNWTAEEPRWVEVLPNCTLKNFVGRYFQIAAVLYPDGRGEKSPVLNSVKLEYESDPLPFPPQSVYAQGTDGAVELSWTPSIHFDTEGYVVYYGERSGEYFYYEPRNVGNVLSCKIDGLKNGRLYFFAVAAYDKAGAQNPGSFSHEVWARPQAAVDCAKKVQDSYEPGKIVEHSDE